MIKAHKIRLYPTPEQAVYFAKAAGTSRFVWNWALAEWNRQYEAGLKPTALKLKKQFNEIRRVQFPWTWEVTKNASDQPFLDLGKAFTAFFEGRARRPKFKSKKRSKPSFYLANDQFEVGDHRIWVPKLGWVNMASFHRVKPVTVAGGSGKTCSCLTACFSARILTARILYLLKIGITTPLCVFSLKPCA